MPLEDFWLDPDMPGFIGPHDLSKYDVPVLDPQIRLRRFFNRIMDRKWNDMIDDHWEYKLGKIHMRSKFYFQVCHNFLFLIILFKLEISLIIDSHLE